MRPLKIILIITLLCVFILPQANAQDNSPKIDSLNVYEQMILDLEQKGVNMMGIFTDSILSKELNDKFKISMDSLRYYYALKYFGGEALEIVNKDHIAVLGKSYGDSIVLRWAPSSAAFADKVYQYGFGLVRISMMKDNQGFVTRNDTAANAIQLLADSLHPIRQWTLEEIGQALPESKDLNSSDSMALVAAWSMHGGMDSSTNAGTGENYINRSKEEDMKFGISLLMADRSSLAADFLGLRFVDRNVELGKRYKYIVFPIGQPIELSGITKIFNDPSKNDVIQDLKIEEGDKKLTLSWPKDINQHSGYWIERSEDNGATWKKLTKTPIVFVDYQASPRKLLNNSDQNAEPEMEERFIYTDTVENYIKYDYRVSGQTPFADYTDYVFVSGTATDLSPPPMPNITEYYVDEKTGIAHLTFDMNYPANQLKDLAGFTVWDAPHVDSTYVQISKLLPPQTRTYSSAKPLDKNRQHYFILKSVDTKGNEMSTFPMYMNIVDDIPPLPPTGLTYFINDTSGVVTLVWNANKERDLGGYKVFFSNSLKNEFTQITKRALTDTLFYDTLALVTLSKEIYYKIRAEDWSYNGSDFSEIITVKRPDYVAPETPVMEVPQIYEGCIKLVWRPSTSKDVEKQILYRRLYKKEKEWLAFAEFEDPQTNSFNDSTASEEQLYEYSLRALDDAGWYSDYSFPVRARRWFDEVIPTVSNLEVNYDDEKGTVDLNWEYETPRHELLDSVGFLYYIYRSAGEEPIARYRMLDSKTLSFTDNRLNQDGVYNYGIQVVFLNGKSSSLITKKLVVKKK